MRRSSDFAEVVKEIAGGRSTREMWRLTGISHTRISDMLFGIIPSYRLLEQFADKAEATEDQRKRLFTTAGYDESAVVEAALDGSDTFYEEFRKLQADYPHLPIPLPHFAGGVRSIKGPDEAREIVAGMRRRVENGLFGDPRRPESDS